MKKRKWWIIPIVVVVVVVAGLFGYNAYAQNRAQAALANIPTTTVKEGTLTATVGAFGSVTPNQSAVLNWQTSGTVDKVYVNIGDKVKAGQVLATLADTSLSQTILNARGDLVAAQEALNTLEQSNTAAAQAQVNLANAEAALNTAKQHAAGVSYPRGSEAVINQVEANITLDQAQVAILQDQFDKVKGLPHSDVRYAQALQALTSATNKLNTDQATLNYLQGKPDQTTIDQLNANLALAQAQYNDALAQWNLLKNGPDPAQLAQAKARVTSDEALIAEAQIVAPFDGTVTAVGIKPGDVITQGTQAFEVDDFSTYYVDLQVSELDINNIKVGQPVQLTLNAIANKTYDGKVTQVSDVGISSSGVVNYNVTVQITNPDNQIKSNMTASANIVVSEIQNALLVPSQSVQTVGNTSLIYMKSNGTLRPVRVTLGQSNGSEIQVISNTLKAGDEIALTPPSTSLFRQNAGLLSIFRFGTGTTGRFEGGGGFPRGGAGGAGGNGGNRGGTGGNTGGFGGN